MARLAKDSKGCIQYRDNGYSIGCWPTISGIGIEFCVSGRYSPSLTTNQARRFAEKILGWCDEIEGKP